MTAPNMMTAQQLLRNYLESPAGSDLLAEMIKHTAEALMDVEVDGLCNAGHGERTPQRTNSRNGHRDRRWDTRAGTIELAVPKLRSGSYFPNWLLQPRRRAEKALTSVICQAYIEGVSTRRVDDLVQSMGIDGISKSQVSVLCAEIDEMVQQFRSRALGECRYVWIDALYHKVREDGRVQSVATLIATGVNVDGHREILGVDVCTTENGAGWTAFLRDLVARGLNGVQLVISDAHTGLKEAVSAVFSSAWQRCRTHFMRNILAKVPKSAQSMVASLVRSIFEQPDADRVHAQFDNVVEQLEQRFAAAAELLVGARDDVLAFTAHPHAHWKQVWSNNPQERLNKETRRRTDVVGIFPNRESLIRLVGAICAEQHDEWQVRRRYMSTETLATSPIKQGDNKEIITAKSTRAQANRLN